MNWLNQVEGILKQYRGAAQAGTTGAGPAAAQPAPSVREQFDQLAHAAPPSRVADGLAEAFRSEKTGSLGSLVSGLFERSNGEQKAALLNELMGAVHPSKVAEVLGGAGLGHALGGARPQVTAEEAQKVSPQAVNELANHAENTNPSVFETLGNFYSRHPTLAKTLGATALGVALKKIAERA